MAHEPSPKRQFTDKEVSEILRRATELQEQVTGTSQDAGTSLEQLQQSAAELGFQPHLVARAAAEIDQSRERPSSFFFWGGPSKIEVERLVGHAITEAEWPEVLATIRRVTGRIGDTSAVGRAWEWTSQSPTVFHVSVTPQGTHSRVKVTFRVGDWAAAIYTMTGISAFVASLGLISTHAWSLPVDMAVVGGLFAGAFAASRVAFQAITRSHRRTVTKLLSVLEAPPEQAEILPQPSITPQTRFDQEPQPVEQVLGISDQR